MTTGQEANIKSFLCSYSRLEATDDYLMLLMAECSWKQLPALAYIDEYIYIKDYFNHSHKTFL